MDLIKHANDLFEGYVKVEKQPFTTIEGALALAEQALPAFKRFLLRASPNNAIVKIGIKPVTSIENKLIRWKDKGRTISTMFDVLRGTIAVGDEDDIQDVIHNLSRGPVLVKHEHKDTPTEFGYYGTHHLDVYLSGYKIVAEIIVSTKRFLAYKKTAHKIYSANRGDVANTPPKELARSRELFRQANKPKVILKKPKPLPSIDPEG